MTEEGISIGELSRQVRDVLIRFETLAARLDVAFVSKELYNLRQQVLDQSLKALEEATDRAASRDSVKKLDESTAKRVEFDELKKRVDGLEDDKRWLIRLVASFIILGILGAVFIVGGGKP